MPPALLPEGRLVFINCPFDTKYRKLLNPIAFTIVDCGYEPLSSLHDSKGGVRFHRIVSMLAACNFAIHDISRTELDAVNKLPRFNMPFELGLDFGLRESGVSKFRKKSCLVLDRSRYRFQKYLSDIAGHDPESHGDDPKRVIEVVRNWLRRVSHDPAIPSPQAICRHYFGFLNDLPAMASAKRMSQKRLLVNNDYFVDLTNLMKDWLKDNYPPESTP